MSVAPYDTAGAVTLADFSSSNMLGAERRTAGGLSFDFRTVTDRVKAGGASGLLTAQNSGKVPVNASWARLDRKFDPWLDLSKHQALGVWVYGDGQGELLGFRLESPKHISYGALADRYVKVDFTGWRYCELVETESVRWSDHVWNDGKWLYNAYREIIDFGHVESLGVWMNDIPAGKAVECRISPVKALPMATNTIRNPSVTIDGKTIVFPVEMPSGSYLEFNSLTDCKLYSPRGEFLADVKPKGAAPAIKPGLNPVKFECESALKLTPRVKVTVISGGEAI